MTAETPPTPTDSYAIWLPFKFESSYELKIPDGSLEVEVGGYPGTIQKAGSGYALLVEGLPTEGDAKTFLNNMGVGLLWAAVDKGKGIAFSLELDRVYHSEDPVKTAENLFGSFGSPLSTTPVHGIHDGDKAAIILSNKNYKKIFAGSVTAKISAGGEGFVSSVNEGLALPTAEAVMSNAKLNLAIETYCLSHFEASASARFLTLFTALEVLNPSRPEPDMIVSLIKEWKDQAGRLAEEHAGAAEGAAFQSLVGRLGYLQNLSIRRGLRELVRDLLKAGGHDDAEELGAEVASLYDKRSSLVHDGSADLGGGLSRLEEITKKTLRAAMQHVSVLDGEP